MASCCCVLHDEPAEIPASLRYKCQISKRLAEQMLLLCTWKGLKGNFLGELLPKTLPMISQHFPLSESWEVD